MTQELTHRGSSGFGIASADGRQEGLARQTGARLLTHRRVQDPEQLVVRGRHERGTKLAPRRLTQALDIVGIGVPGGQLGCRQPQGVGQFSRLCVEQAVRARVLPDRLVDHGRIHRSHPDPAPHPHVKEPARTQASHGLANHGARYAELSSQVAFGRERVAGLEPLIDDRAHDAFRNPVRQARLAEHERPRLELLRSRSLVSPVQSVIRHDTV